MRLVFFLSALVFFNSSGIDHKGDFKIAVINLKKIASESLAGKSIESQIANINNKASKDLVEFENSIKKIDSDQKDRESERKVEDLQVLLYDMTRKKRYQIQSAYKTAIETLEKEIYKAAEQVSQKRGYSLVVISDVIVFKSDDCPDISEETIELLNKNVSEVKVELKESQQ